MASITIGSRGMESAVRSMPTDESVLLLARSYDKLIKDLEYALTHLSRENLSPELRALLEGDDA